MTAILSMFPDYFLSEYQRLGRFARTDRLARWLKCPAFKRKERIAGQNLYGIGTKRACHVAGLRFWMSSPLQSPLWRAPCLQELLLFHLSLKIRRVDSRVHVHDKKKWRFFFVSYSSVSEATAFSGVQEV